MFNVQWYYIMWNGTVPVVLKGENVWKCLYLNWLDGPKVVNNQLLVLVQFTCICMKSFLYYHQVDFTFSHNMWKCILLQNNSMK